MVVLESSKSVPAPLGRGGATLPSSDFPSLLLPAGGERDAMQVLALGSVVGLLFAHTRGKTWHVCILRQRCHPVIFTPFLSSQKKGLTLFQPRRKGLHHPGKSRLVGRGVLGAC